MEEDCRDDFAHCLEAFDIRLEDAMSDAMIEVQMNLAIGALPVDDDLWEQWCQLKRACMDDARAHPPSTFGSDSRATATVAARAEFVESEI